eukprot:748523-Hanusia_phi.AAC.1
MERLHTCAELTGWVGIIAKCPKGGGGRRRGMAADQGGRRRRAGGACTMVGVVCFSLIASSSSFVVPFSSHLISLSRSACRGIRPNGAALNFGPARVGTYVGAREGRRVRGALTTVCVFDQVMKNLGSMGDILSKGIAGPSLDELKSILGEQEYAAVMKTINGVIDKNKREISGIESKALEDARKRQKEAR